MQDERRKRLGSSQTSQSPLFFSWNASVAPRLPSECLGKASRSRDLPRVSQPEVVEDFKSVNYNIELFTFTRIIAKLQPLFFVWSGKLCSGKMCKRQTNDGYLDSSNGLSSAEHHSKIKYCTESFTGKVPLWPKFQYYLKILKPIQVRKSSLCYSMIFLRVYLFIHVVNMKFDTWTSITYAP